MQTFMPYPSFCQSLRCLDNKRLGKQRVEAKQILTVLQRGRTGAWCNHPAIRMWEGYEEALMMYYNISLIEWAERGFRNVLLVPISHSNFSPHPPWMYDWNFQLSHRSNLVRKDPAFYGKLWDVPNNLPYYWPV